MAVDSGPVPQFELLHAYSTIQSVLARRPPDPLMEVWRPIPGFEHYRINRCGEVYNSRGWLLKTQYKRSPHRKWAMESLTLCYNSKQTSFTVSRLLQMTFPEDYPNKNKE